MSRILYQTPHLIAVHKPAGWVSERHPHYPSAEQYVIDHLSKRYRNPFVGIIHRIDRVTSGVQLLAKKRSSLRKLNQQFAERKVDKRYLARVTTPLPEEKGTLDHWHQRSADGRRAEVFSEKRPDAKPITLRYALRTQEADTWLYEIELLTGKFHQIRAQLAQAGSPILGDTAYGATTDWKEGAIALHAWQLAFDHPVSGERITVEVLPEWLKKERKGEEPA